MALAGIVAIAAVLRFDGLGSMPLNPYYDAAVRSMGSSFHAFLVGAFDPNASVAVDKPPLDLWLQVATTKLFGFTHFSLLLPEALASTAAVVLLYDVVRRGFGRIAGLCAAAALAMLPVDVMTARSDTMDGLMMALLVLAAWLVVRAVQTGRARWLYAAGAAMGLAFETKLFEALVALPALALLFVVGSRAPWSRRAGQLAVAGGVMIAVGLAWTGAFALAPAAQRPYPMGSTNGSIWNTVFVYNGIGRLTSTSTRTAADALIPPGVARLFSGGPVHLNLLIGEVLLAALVFGLLAAGLGVTHFRRRGGLPPALAAAMGVWLVVGAGVLSFMRHMPVRYLEPITPAVAAVLGIGVAYTARGAAGALFGSRGAGRIVPPLTVLLAVLALVGVLASPASESLALVRTQASDSGSLGYMPTRTVAALSSYLRRHRGHTRYEFAAAEADVAGPLIVADDQPVLILAGTPFHPLMSPRGLRQAVRAGEVRYVLLGNVPIDHPPHPFTPRNPRETIPAWVIRHGTDVTRQAGLGGYGMLYRLSSPAGSRNRLRKFHTVFAASRPVGLRLGIGWLFRPAREVSPPGQP